MKPEESKRLVLLTGPPRIGKTTVLLNAAEELGARGYRLAGMISQEIREGDVRVGFEIRVYETGGQGWLAHIRQYGGPRIGKYRVNLNDLNSVGVASILNALEDADIVLIDEIGPMELFSNTFKEAVLKVVESPKPLLGTIHYRVKHSLVNKIKSRKDAHIIEVTQKNRNQIPTLIANEIICFITMRKLSYPKKGDEKKRYSLERSKSP
jgi:nucleoside-triphosphatase